MRADRIMPVEHDRIAARNDAGKSAITLGNLHSCAALFIGPDHPIAPVYVPDARIGERERKKPVTNPDKDGQN